MNYYRLIIAGSRTWNDENTMVKYINVFVQQNLTPREDKPLLEIISGHARGADQMGEKIARSNKVKLTIMKAEWDRFGISAGYKRNEQMAAYAAEQNMGGCIVFWDGKSKGSMHMFRLASQYKLTTVLVSPRQEDFKEIEALTGIKQENKLI